MLIHWLLLLGLLDPSQNLIPTPLDEIGSRMILSAASMQDTTALLVIEGRTASASMYLFDYQKARCYRVDDLRLKTTAGSFVYAHRDQFVILDGVTRTWTTLNSKGNFLESIPFSRVKGFDSSKLLMFLASQKSGYGFAKSVDRAAGKDHYFRIDLTEQSMSLLRTSDYAEGVYLLEVPNGSLRIATATREIVRTGGQSSPKHLLGGKDSVANPQRKNYAKVGIRAAYLPQITPPLAVGHLLSFFELNREQSGQLEKSPLVLDLKTNQISRPRVLPIGRNADGSMLLVFDSAEEEFALTDVATLSR